jgi:hypothetical protein
MHISIWTKEDIEAFLILRRRHDEAIASLEKELLAVDEDNEQVPQKDSL